MRVVVIAEDYRNDQYILKPIVRAMMEAVGKRRATVVVPQEPLLGGFGEALKWERIEEFINRFEAMADLFLLCIDRDGKPGRRKSLDGIEARAAARLTGGKLLLGENAWQEVDAWVLAGHDLPSGWRWQDIRQEIQCKERYFIPFATQRGVRDGPGEGRRTLAAEAARRYDRIRGLCNEVSGLERRIQDWIGGAK